MNRLCDVCLKTDAVLFNKVIDGGCEQTYAFCENCYKQIISSGLNPIDIAKNKKSKIGLECISCGYSVERFQKTLLFGCPDCYRYMRSYICDYLIKTSQGNNYLGKKNRLRYSADKQIYNLLTNDYKNASNCNESDLVKYNVISSRIRLARNLENFLFPQDNKNVDKIAEFINFIYEISKTSIKSNIYPLNKLSKEQRTVLIERNLISINLANSNKPSAVIMESNTNFGISIMINEEDFIREQCIEEGLNLEYAYAKLNNFDNDLISNMDIAFDEQFGFLTSCPSNLGTGLRASTMVFLPALRISGKLDSVLTLLKNKYDLTIRGLFGEGTEAYYDCYQISNAHTLSKKEIDIINTIHQATVEICYLERSALDELLKQNKNDMYDKISRSYALLSSAYKLSLNEFRELLVYVKLGVILNILPLKNIENINDLIFSTSYSSLALLDGECEADVKRAEIVKKALFKEKL